MKKISLILVFVIVLICSVNVLNGKKEMNIQELPDVKINIQDGTLSRTGVTIIITDLGENKKTYDEWYRIDKKENGKWRMLKAKQDNWFKLIEYHVNQNNKLKFSIDWTSSYGKLENGEYRLVKKANQKYISVEFIIK